jgi:hypothetical protein
MDKVIEYVTYQGVRMIVKRRFTYKGIAKVELFNPANGSMFVVDAASL